MTRCACRTHSALNTSSSLRSLSTPVLKLLNQRGGCFNLHVIYRTHDEAGCVTLALGSLESKVFSSSQMEELSLAAVSMTPDHARGIDSGRHRILRHHLYSQTGNREVSTRSDFSISPRPSDTSSVRRVISNIPPVFSLGVAHPCQLPSATNTSANIEAEPCKRDP